MDHPFGGGAVRIAAEGRAFQLGENLVAAAPTDSDSRGPGRERA
jgi:hypothetical protein